MPARLHVAHQDARMPTWSTNVLMPGVVPDPTPITHLTSVENLESIANTGRLYCPRTLKARRIGYRDISNAEIQRTRACFPVSCGPCGTLHDYVPFFFNPLSPMLYKKVMDWYGPIDHRSLAHVFTDAQAIVASGKAFVFTTGHATMVQSDYYQDLADLQHIDWDVIAGRWWYNTAEDPNRQCRREAEFLVHDSLPLHAAGKIVVFDGETQATVQQWLVAAAIDVPVVAEPECFYQGR